MSYRRRKLWENQATKRPSYVKAKWLIDQAIESTT